MTRPLDFESEGDRREWEAQERALHDERLGIQPEATGDARLGDYRMIVRTLCHPPLDPIPADFAARAAERAERSSAVDDDRFESRLRNALLALLAAVAVGTWAVFAPHWLSAIRLALDQPPAGTIAGWGAVILCCLALSSALEHWKRLRERRGR